MSIHPEIISLQRLKDHTRELMEKERWNQVIKNLWLWNIELKKDDRDTELIDLIKKEKITLRGFKYPGARTQHINKRYLTYKEWYDRTMTNTWEKGYFENQKYEPYKLEEDDVNLGKIK